MPLFVSPLTAYFPNLCRECVSSCTYGAMLDGALVNIIVERSQACTKMIILCTVLFLIYTYVPLVFLPGDVIIF